MQTLFYLPISYYVYCLLFAYLENKNLYFNIYENVALNAFITFLSLRDMNIIKQENLNDLSQAIFTQIQSIAISSI